MVAIGRWNREPMTRLPRWFPVGSYTSLVNDSGRESLQAWRGIKKMNSENHLNTNVTIELNVSTLVGSFSMVEEKKRGKKVK